MQFFVSSSLSLSRCVCVVYIEIYPLDYFRKSHQTSTINKFNTCRSLQRQLRKFLGWIYVCGTCPIFSALPPPSTRTFPLLVSHTQQVKCAESTVTFISFNLRLLPRLRLPHSLLLPLAHSLRRLTSQMERENGKVCALWHLQNCKQPPSPTSFSPQTCRFPIMMQGFHANSVGKMCENQQKSDGNCLKEDWNIFIFALRNHSTVIIS